MPVHPQAQAVLDLMAAFGIEQISDLGVEGARAALVQLGADTPRPDMAEVRTVPIPGPAGTIPARLYRPEGAPTDGAPVVVWFHGGGWVIGSLETSDATCRWLARRSGAVVVSVDYRLAPEHAFPAAVDDAWAATQWVATQGDALGVDTDRLVVAGDSAGGNLAAVVALLARDAGGPSIRLQVLVYPAVDGRLGQRSITENGRGYALTQADMDWFYRHYGLGTAVSAEDWRLSPLLASALTGLAPAVVVTAEFDPLRDEGDAYAAALEGAGVSVQHRRFEGMIHGFFGMVGTVDAAEEAQEEVAKAIASAVT